MLKIDSHVHFWQLARGDYSWMTADMQNIQRDFGPADFEALRQSCNISEIILVQAAASLAETRYIIDLANDCDFVSGVVGRVDIESANTALQQLDEFATLPRFRGIRPMLKNMDTNRWLELPSLDRVIRRTIEHDLTFECMVLPHEIDELLIWLGKYPDLRAVLSHGGMPDIAGGEFDYWASRMTRIAVETRVYCKLSGLTTLAATGFDTETLRPYIEHLLVCFGAERLIWGSDWPVMLGAGSYEDWCSICEKILRGLDEQGRQAIYAGNAGSFYKLDANCLN